MQMQMLAPGAVLALWTLVILLWMSVARFLAFPKAGLSLGKAPPGVRGGDVEEMLPPQAVWKSHNYTHLLEQPTIFYPVVVILALAGPTALDVWFAWGYVALRIVHSLWQSLVNRIPVRVILFTMSSLVLLVLAVRAVMVTLNAEIGGTA